MDTTQNRCNRQADPYHGNAGESERSSEIHGTHAGPDLRRAFSAQARLIAARAERDLTVGDESLQNLLRIYCNLVVEEPVRAT